MKIHLPRAIFSPVDIWPRPGVAMVEANNKTAKNKAAMVKSKPALTQVKSTRKKKKPLNYFC